MSGYTDMVLVDDNGMRIDGRTAILNLIESKLSLSRCLTCSGKIGCCSAQSCSCC